MNIRFNPTSDLRDELDGSPCYFEVWDANSDKRLRVSRRQCRAMGFTESDIECACSNRGAFVAVPMMKQAKI